MGDDAEIITTPDAATDDADTDTPQEVSPPQTEQIAETPADVLAYQETVVEALDELRETHLLDAGATLLLAGVLLGCLVILVIRGWGRG